MHVHRTKEAHYTSMLRCLRMDVSFNACLQSEVLGIGGSVYLDHNGRC